MNLDPSTMILLFRKWTAMGSSEWRVTGRTSFLPHNPQPSMLWTDGKLCSIYAAVPV